MTKAESGKEKSAQSCFIGKQTQNPVSLIRRTSGALHRSPLPPFPNRKSKSRIGNRKFIPSTRPHAPPPSPMPILPPRRPSHRARRRDRVQTANQPALPIKNRQLRRLR